MTLTYNSTSSMQNYKLNYHNEIDHKRRYMTPLTKMHENLRVSNVRGNIHQSCTISNRRVPLRYTFIEQRSHSPVEVNPVQLEDLHEKTNKCLEEYEPVCNLNSLANEVLEEKETNFVAENKMKLADSKIGNAFYPKSKFDFEYSFKQYLSQVACDESYRIKRKKQDPNDANKSIIKLRKVNSIDKETRPNKMNKPKSASVAGLEQNSYIATLSHPLTTKDRQSKNQYYLNKRKNNISHSTEIKSTSIVPHESNTSVMNVGTENVKEKYGVDLKHYFDIIDEPLVDRNLKIQETPKCDAHANFKVVRLNNSHFTVVPVTNNEAAVNENFWVNELPKSNGANFSDIQMNYNNLNVSVTNSVSVLDPLISSEVPKSQATTNANSSENEMPKSNDSANVNLKVVQVSKNNFRVVPVTNNEAVLDQNLVANEVPNCNKVQDVNCNIKEKTKDSGVFMDHFTVVSENNISSNDEVNENTIFADWADDIALDDFNINLDFLNETNDDFSVNFEQLIKMCEHSNPNASICLASNLDSKRNCDLETYLATEEFNSFINYL